jgi:hypothetical protein
VWAGLTNHFDRLRLLGDKSAVVDGSPFAKASDLGPARADPREIEAPIDPHQPLVSPAFEPDEHVVFVEDKQNAGNGPYVVGVENFNAQARERPPHCATTESSAVAKHALG